MRRDRRIALACHRRRRYGRRYLGTVRTRITRETIEACTPAPFATAAREALAEERHVVIDPTGGLATFAVFQRWFAGR